MTRLLAVLVCIPVTLGCAHVSLPESVQAAEAALKASDIAADTAMGVVETATEAAILRCQAKLGDEYTEAEARACMGPLAADVEPVALEMREAYQQAYDAVQALKTAAKDLQPLLDAAREELE